VNRLQALPLKYASPVLALKQETMAS
jgi:hypothetical protein